MKSVIFYSAIVLLAVSIFLWGFNFHIGIGGSYFSFTINGILK